MSQTSVTSYYSTRKRRLATVGKKEIKASSSPSESLKGCSAFLASLCDQKIINPASDNQSDSSNKPRDETTREKIGKASRTKSKKPANNTNRKGKKKEATDIRTAFRTQTIKKSTTEDTKKEDQVNTLNTTYELEASTLPVSEVPILRTPKRTLTEPEEPPVDSKKKKSSSVQEDDAAVSPSTSSTFEKKDKDTHRAARKKLDMGTQPVVPEEEPGDVPKRSSSLEAKQKSFSCKNREDLKEKSQYLEKMLQKLRAFQNNKCKITSVVASAVNRKSTSESEEKVPCYEKFSSLAAAGPPSLVLPYKYRMLSEMFRSSDTIVSMLHNRKERCTFEKLKSGVQDMTKRSFSKSNLGQIKTVFPTAYSYDIEKNPPAVINRKPGTPLYQLVITPVLNTGPKDSPKKSKGKSQSSIAANLMTPSCLVERNSIFSSKLLNITKHHHQTFLSKLDPPISIPPEKLTKWHPKFHVDGVPDIEVASLPEPPNVNKIDTAMDVLNKIKGKTSLKIEKALEEVAKMNLENEPEKKVEKQEEKITKGVLKGLSMDLLQRIRARESARIVEEMTTDVGQQKRDEMMERIPELVSILRTYFITERKLSMSVEDAAKRLSDSYHTTLPPGDVENHIQLMSELFPKWLTLIPVRNIMYVKIDKNADINTMLRNIPKK